MCLRYMGANPSEFADATVCPCPCTKEFYDNMMLWHRCVSEREQYGELPYTVREEMEMRRNEGKHQRKLPKRRVKEMPLTQQRLQI